MNEQKIYEANIEKRLIEVGNKLPVTPKPETRYDLPAKLSPTQKVLTEYAQPKPDWNKWQMELGQEMSSEILTYAQGTEKLPYQVRSQLNYIAENYGYTTGDDMLRDILISMQ